MTNWYDHSDAQEKRLRNSRPLSSNEFILAVFPPVGTGDDRKGYYKAARLHDTALVQAG